MPFVKYIDLEPIRRLRYRGRELLGKEIYLTEKRDGSCIALWLDENEAIKISSRNQEEAEEDLQNRVRNTPEFKNIESFLTRICSLSGMEYVIYAELIYGGKVSPARAEKYNKYDKLIMFDILSAGSGEFLHYNAVHQYAHQFKIPVVRCFQVVEPTRWEEVEELKTLCRTLAKRHRREGIVGKVYAGVGRERIFFKEKVDLPDIPRTEKEKDTVALPPMPTEKIKRALQHAYDEIISRFGDAAPEKWKDRSIAMPIVVNHINTEAKEHLFSPPRNIYQLYLDFSI